MKVRDNTHRLTVGRKAEALLKMVANNGNKNTLVFMVGFECIAILMNRRQASIQQDCDGGNKNCKLTMEFAYQKNINTKTQPHQRPKANWWLLVNNFIQINAKSPRTFRFFWRRFGIDQSVGCLLVSCLRVFCFFVCVAALLLLRCCCCCCCCCCAALFVVWCVV